MPLQNLQIGNTVRSFLTKELIKVDWLVMKHIQDGNIQNVYDLRPVYEPVEPTEELLLDLGFERFPHVIVNPSLFFQLDRERNISVAAIGTPNEMVFICDTSNKPRIEAIVIRNYDYDGKTYLHDIENIIHAFNPKLNLYEKTKNEP